MGLELTSWIDGCLLGTEFFNSAAAANGNMVAFFIKDVLHVLVPETLQDGYPREAFIKDLGDVKFVQAAYAKNGDRALSLSFEDGTDAPFVVGFERHHVRFYGREEIVRPEIGWMQFHYGPDVFSRVIEYRLYSFPVTVAEHILPEPPKLDFGPKKISGANKIRIEKFVERFFELCGNDCYDFEEFLSDFHRCFTDEWETLKWHLAEPWNAGADRVGRGFLKVSASTAEQLVSMPRFDMRKFG